MLRSQYRRFLSTTRSHSLWNSSGDSFPIDVHPEIQDGLHSNRPVVALETALVTHGFQYPTNFELALSLEDQVRSAGAIPATIGIVGGRIKVGLTKPELELLADPAQKHMTRKISRRDIAPALVSKVHGGTTCSGTLAIATKLGLKVFATGGLGGVHKGGELSMDISADLNDLSKSPVGLVSGGVKSILDIGRTLEYLETLGVPVITYGPTNDFPAFFTRTSGLQAPWNAETPEDVALILNHQLQLETGMLIAVPVPAEHEANAAKVQGAIDQAVKEAEENGIVGKAVTPWLLSRIAVLTNQESVRANAALLRHTAFVGGRVAVAYAKLISGETSAIAARQDEVKRNDPLPSQNTLPDPDIIVIGATAVDISARFDSKSSHAQRSTGPGKVTLSLGGVGRNMAEAAHRLNGKPGATMLVSPIGSDYFGSIVHEHTRNLGMRTDGLIPSLSSTAVCNILLDEDGTLITGVADMDGTSTFDIKTVIQYIRNYRPKIVALDGNLSWNMLGATIETCNSVEIPVVFEPVSTSKAGVIIQALQSLDMQTSFPRVKICTPNQDELRSLYEISQGNLLSKNDWWDTIDRFSLGVQYGNELALLSRRASGDDESGERLSFLVDEGIAQMATSLLPFFQCLVIKCGRNGAILAMRIQDKNSKWHEESSNIFDRYVIAHGKDESILIRHFPALPIDGIVNVTGAGDSLVGALIACLAKNPSALGNPVSMASTMRICQQAACLTLGNEAAVSPLLSRLKSET